ncbi:MAG: lytic murein transglycosylase [Rhodobacteraceae bacterium]|nr:lytic murein transglycosylase [Paracoccaceae bacterium]
MRLTRRQFALAGLSTALAGCAAGDARPPGSAARPDPGLTPAANAGYDAWVAGFRRRALAQGIDAATLNAGFRGAGFLPGVVARDRNQTEFRRTLEDYLAIVASDAKIAAGRAAAQRQAGLLAEIAERYRVPAPVLAAVWGMESNYGARRGSIPVVSAVSTLAYDGRRGVFFERQLIAALRILQRGDVPARRLTGSWAGAMGHTQFIPTTFEAYAVDFRGDGRRDIWSDDPTDALASAAAYLARSGWRGGAPWGLEVRVPEGLSPALAGRGNRRAVADWRARGLRPARGTADLPDHGPAALLLPMGPRAPAFLVFRNFDAILRYNASENYGIGIGYLSDRIAGGGPLVGQFPPDSNGLRLDDRRRLQTRLTARGYDTGGTDGVIGPKTEAAIRAFQRDAGLPVTGTPTPAFLRALG